MNLSLASPPLFRPLSMVTSTGMDSGLSVSYITLTGGITSLKGAQETIQRFSQYAGNLNGIVLDSTVTRSSDNSTMTIAMTYGFEDADDAVYVCERADRALAGNAWYLNFTRAC